MSARRSSAAALIKTPSSAAISIEFVNCYFGGTSSRSSDDAQKRVPPGNRHEGKESEQSGDSRRQSERFKSFTYEELTKRDKVNLDILIPSLPSLSQPLGLPV
jgi:hypothetical protein